MLGIFINFFVDFRIFIMKNDIGLKNIFLKILNIKLKGFITMLNIFFNIFFKVTIILTFIFIINELIVSIYTVMPIKTPKSINNRISPLLNTNIEYSIIAPVKIQNIISSIYVIKSFVLKLFLRILKKSNNKPINIPINYEY